MKYRKKPGPNRSLGLALAAIVAGGSMTSTLMPVYATEQSFEDGGFDEAPADTSSGNSSAADSNDGWIEDLDHGNGADAGVSANNGSPVENTSDFSGTVNGGEVAAPNQPAAEDTTPDTSGHMGASAEDESLADEELFGMEEESDLILGDIDNHRQSSTVLDGIDISNWQNTIDLDLIDADFIICKATGGTGFKDRSFDYFAQKILDSGRLFGFYHFAHDSGYEGSAQDEAKFFYEQTKQYIGKGIPILDFEDHDVLAKGASWALDFLETYYKLSGVKPMLYTSSYYTRTIDWTPVAKAGYQLWVANYGKNDEQQGYRETAEVKTDLLGTGAFEEYYMHQYTSRGKLEGYEGNLDLNKFYGTKEEWQTLSQPEGLSKTLLRLYNPNSGEHFYTASREEKKILTNLGWTDEGFAWTTPGAGQNVYRLYNPNSGDHHYTVDVNERDTLISYGWQAEGVGWLAVEDRKEGVPVYRAYNPNAETGAHHFTTSVEEINALVAMGWENEGVAWYAVDPGKTFETGEEFEDMKQRVDLQRSSPFSSSLPSLLGIRTNR